MKRDASMPQQGPANKPDGTSVSAQESALFRQTIGQIESLPDNKKRNCQPTSTPAPRPRQTEADENAVVEELLDAPPLDIETGDNLSWRRNGVQLAVLRKLRRGHYSCQQALDLHGMTVAMARQALARFLHDAQIHDWHCVRIVHGKGLRSGHRGPVLKAKVGGWLRRRNDVVAFCSTPNHDGGTGAIYVLLKNK